MATTKRRNKWVHPRVGGETVAILSTSAVSMGSSPRGRGNRGEDTVVNRSLGFIPAWAGKPLSTERTGPF